MRFQRVLLLLCVTTLITGCTREQSDHANAVVETVDGGVFFAGYTQPVCAEESQVYAGKTDASGVWEWTNVYGGAGNHQAAAVQVTADGDFLVAGFSEALDSADRDMYLLKLNDAGEELWSRTYDAAGDEEVRAMALFANGDIALLGQTGEEEVVLLRCDGEGNELWRQVFSGTGRKVAKNVKITPTDDLYLLTSGAEFTFTYMDLYAYVDGALIRTDGSGQETWGMDVSYMNDFDLCPDGNLVLTGYADSPNAHPNSIRLRKISPTGETIWDAPQHGHEGNRLWVYPDGSIALAGRTPMISDGYMGVVTRTDDMGNLRWRESGTWDKRKTQVMNISSDGGVIVDVFHRVNSTFDYFVGYTPYDVFLLRLDTEGKSLWEARQGHLSEESCRITYDFTASVQAVVFAFFASLMGGLGV